MLQVIIVTMNHGNPILKHCTLKVSDEAENCTLYAGPIITSNNDDDFNMFGNHSKIKSFMTKNPTYFNDFLDVKDRLVCLIKLEASPNTSVGMPADVLFLYKNRSKWFKNIKGCIIKE